MPTNSGLSLVEILVGLGIVGIGLYAVAQMVVMSNQATVSAARMTEVNQTSEFIHNLLNSTDTCSATFKDLIIKAQLNIRQEGPEALYGVDENGNKGTALIRVNTTLIARVFKISGMKIILQGLVKSAPNQHIYWAKLITNYRSDHSQIGGQVFYREHDFYPVLEKKSGNTRIVGCNPQLSGGGTAPPEVGYIKGGMYGGCVLREYGSGTKQVTSSFDPAYAWGMGKSECRCFRDFGLFQTGKNSLPLGSETYYTCIKL